MPTNAAGQIVTDQGTTADEINALAEHLTDTVAERLAAAGIDPSNLDPNYAAMAAQYAREILDETRDAFNGSPVVEAVIQAQDWNAIIEPGGLYDQASAPTNAVQQGHVVTSGYASGGQVIEQGGYDIDAAGTVTPFGNLDLTPAGVTPRMAPPLEADDTGLIYDANGGGGGESSGITELPPPNSTAHPDEVIPPSLDLGSAVGGALGGGAMFALGLGAALLLKRHEQRRRRGR